MGTNEIYDGFGAWRPRRAAVKLRYPNDLFAPYRYNIFTLPGSSNAAGHSGEQPATTSDSKESHKNSLYKKLFSIHSLLLFIFSLEYRFGRVEFVYGDLAHQCKAGEDGGERSAVQRWVKQNESCRLHPSSCYASSWGRVSFVHKPWQYLFVDKFMHSSGYKYFETMYNYCYQTARSSSAWFKAKEDDSDILLRLPFPNRFVKAQQRP